MFSRPFSLTLKLCALLVLPVLIAAGALLSGPAGFGPGEPQSAEAATFNEIKKLLASDAQDFDRAGFSVAVSGHTAVVGAQFEDAGGSTTPARPMSSSVTRAARTAGAR